MSFGKFYEHIDVFLYICAYIFGLLSLMMVLVVKVNIGQSMSLERNTERKIE